MSFSRLHVSLYKLHIVYSQSKLHNCTIEVQLRSNTTSLITSYRFTSDHSGSNWFRNFVRVSSIILGREALNLSSRVNGPCTLGQRYSKTPSVSVFLNEFVLSQLHGHRSGILLCMHEVIIPFRILCSKSSKLL